MMGKRQDKPAWPRLTLASGPVDVIVERVTQPRAEPVWLFSKKTLDAMPAEFAEVSSRTQRYLPRFLFERSVANVRLYEWLAVIVGLPVFFLLTALLNRALMPIARFALTRVFARTDPSFKQALHTAPSAASRRAANPSASTNCAAGSSWSVFATHSQLPRVASPNGGIGCAICSLRYFAVTSSAKNRRLSWS